MGVLWKKRQLDKPYRGRKMIVSDSYVTCVADYVTKTDKAVLVIQFGEEIWLPRSALSWSSDQKLDALKNGEEFEFFIRQWCATQKGLEYS